MTTVSREPSVPSWFALPLTLLWVTLGLGIALWRMHWPAVELCGSVLAIAAGAKLWSRLSLARVNVVMAVDRVRLFAGESFALQIEAENAKLLAVWIETAVPLPAALRSVRGDAAAVRADTGLGAYQRASFRVPVRALRRGIHVLGPSTISTGDPLGFFRRTKPAGSCEVVVYPRIIAIHAPALPRRDFFDRPGSYSPVVDPTHVQGVRDYQPGTSARYIHWQTSARQQRLVEKVCEPTQQELVLLALSVAGFEAPSAEVQLERCLEVVAALALQLSQRRLPLGFVTDCRVRGASNVLPPARPPEQLTTLFETLARLEPVADADLVELMQAAALLTATTTVVLFSHALPREDDPLVSLLRRRRVPVVTVSCDPTTPDHTSSHRLQDLRVDAA